MKVMFKDQNEFDQIFKPNELTKAHSQYIYLNEDRTKLYKKYYDRYSAFLVKKLFGIIVLNETAITQEEISFLDNLILKTEQKSRSKIM